MLEYALNILKLFVDYAVLVKESSTSHPAVLHLTDLFESNSEFLQKLGTQKEHKALMTSITEFLDSSSHEKIFGDQESKNNDTEHKKIDKKKLLEKKKKDIMEKMKQKRTQLASQYIFDASSSSANDSQSNLSESEQVDVQKCQKCYEPLYSEEFSEKPFGYLASV